uniref:Vitronectin b n=1 Tax=Sinocyclocheilus anshuiensis TaxID=1608454 RepID=A0A671QSH9_9TELE
FDANTSVVGLKALLKQRLAQETCVGRCQSGFDPTKKCQCDRMCKYYGSCCVDFDIARGDMFDVPEDDLTSSVSPAEEQISPPMSPTVPPDPEAVTCSGRFFLFLSSSSGWLHNAFFICVLGDYFFELDDKSVMPGYPKLIKDVRGISVPIDAAFTRINRQGKTYIFKGNKYWRFAGDVLDEDYPRDISVGFEKIPDDIDAAFAIPAPGHHGREKYYQYVFKHHPSHEECDHMTKSSPSVAFTRYTNLYCDLDNVFALLFQGSKSVCICWPRFISKDWIGIKPPIDAAMVGRLYVSPVPSPSPATSLKKRGKNQKKGRGRCPFWFDMSYDPDDYIDVEIVQEKATPVQMSTSLKRYFKQR